MLIRLYLGITDFAMLIGEIQINLFSAAAQRMSDQVRVSKAQKLGLRLMELNVQVQDVCCVPLATLNAI